MEDAAQAQGERLLRFFSMVVAGLAASSPHMISCAVTALARLLFEFSSSLLHTVPQLMPSVLLLLQSRSREIIKSVLGFVKVIVVRLPVEELPPLLGPMVEGLLLWSDDSKNHFKAKACLPPAPCLPGPAGPSAVQSIAKSWHDEIACPSLLCRMRTAQCDTGALGHWHVTLAYFSATCWWAGSWSLKKGSSLWLVLWTSSPL
jgi:hypothetical protein